MREIKFRAWHKERKSKHSVSCINFYDEYIYVDEYATGTGERMKLSEVELMQYTGLKDKNGKEIYEGDIVRTHPGKDKRIKFLDTFEKVEFKDGSFIVQGITIPRQWNELYKETHRIEIIGNIYENPELIK